MATFFDTHKYLLFGAAFRNPRNSELPLGIRADRLLRLIGTPDECYRRQRNDALAELWTPPPPSSESESIVVV